jgi:5-histidylcysteine sulfoxide synthase/putative 4-mercaptohistidine N1-methyltranferase
MSSALQSARTVDLVSGEAEAKREEIRRYFHATFDIEDRLYESLRDDDAFYERSDPLRHPLIFYLGHTATFFVNKLILARVLTERLNPEFESIFAIGVDEMSWDDLNEEHYDWPSVPDVWAYRRQVREALDRVITELPIALPIGWDAPFWPVLMGIEHQRIHLETSSVLIRQLPLSRVEPHPDFPVCRVSGDAPENRLLDVPRGRVALGKPRDHALYGWDNEYGRHEAEVPAFRASQFLVSNGEFEKFVAAGGYREDRWWTDEGRRWRDFKSPEHPLFWRPDGEGGYRLRLIHEEIPMPWNWPVEVNCLEARAFCAWLSEVEGESLRLPTEEEWCRLYDTAGVPDVPEWESAPGNINLEHYASACPVDEFSFGDFFDVIGNVWQWTETPIAGFTGFKVHPLYDDFSTPTFDTQHNLIKGGSFISTGNEATRHARYAFRRHFYQHAGFRIIESKHAASVKSDVYETDELLAQYCEFHWGEEYFGVPNFAAACARILLEATSGRTRERALDLGCAVGRSTFELAREYDHVTGLDFSARFIRIADDLKEKGYIQYVLPEEGDLVSYHEQRLDACDLPDVSSKVEFFQADACNLKPLYTDYDLVFAGNLIDRLYSPRKFLEMIHERIRPGGLLVLASPYTWLTDYTGKEEWIGGFKRDGENVTTLDGLTEVLAPRFRMLGEPRDVPFVIRETRRKYQYTVSELTVWELRD